MDSLKILLNKALSKKSVETKKTLNVELKGNKKLLPEGMINGYVNSYELYNDERRNCNKIRLICKINSLCSNVLFNPKTEIWRYENDGTITSLNYDKVESSKISDKIVGKTEDFRWNSYEAIRDTQLSNDACGFVYNCGIDILNNHLIRNNTFKSVRLSNYSEEEFYDPNYFNTIEDYLRGYDGKNVIEEVGRTTSWNGNPYPGTESIQYNDFTSCELIRKSDGTQYYRVRPDLSFIDASKPPTGGIFRIYVYFQADVTFNSGTEQTQSFFSTSFSYTGNRDGLFPFDYSTIVDINTVSGATTGFKMSNGVAYIINVSPDHDENYTYVNSDKKSKKYRVKVPMHLYQKDDIMTFSEAISEALFEKDGWFGFKNNAHIPTYNVDMDSKNLSTMDITKPINSSKACDFIDMYPDRTLFSFSPKFNENKNRIEHNWKYCLTYPSSSTTEGFDNFLNSDINSLKIAYFDEFVKDDNGVSLITFYSIAQHGLQNGDYVNIYNTYYDEEGNIHNDILFSGVEVYMIYDKYIFSIVKTNTELSNQWINNDDYSATTFDISGEEQNIIFDTTNRHRYQVKDKNEYFYVVSDTDRVNTDPKFQNLSFKRVSQSGIECKYYVRIFSRIPNFKFASEEINDYTIHSNNNRLISKYAFDDFDNHTNKIAFSKNIFTDPIGEVVYTDDIDVSYLKDNLGRPISEIYMTIVKNNAGFRKWYGKNGSEIDVNDDSVEFSHCFGENVCSFEFSDESMKADMINDVRKLNNCDSTPNTIGLNIKSLNKTKYDSRLRSDEIQYENTEHFFGDLCCYSPTDCYEQILQPVMDRFNTAQRELTINDTSYKYFSSITTDEIEYDDLGIYSSYTMSRDTKMCIPRKEGYYYKMHYPITFRTISSELKSEKSMNYTILMIKVGNSSQITLNGDIPYFISVKESTIFTTNSKFVLYYKKNNSIYYAKVIKMLSQNKMLILVYNESNQIVQLPALIDVNDYVLCYNDDVNIPSYAQIIKDGSCRYYWRDVISNGFDENSNIETYPFANGAIYITKDINLYLMRQDKNGDVGLKYYNMSFIEEYEPEGITYRNNVIYDDYHEEEIREC